MRAPSSCQHRGSMIAQKRACMAGSKTANSGRINPHREIISRGNRERRETAKSTQQPAAPTTSRTTHNNRNNAHPQILPCVFDERIEKRRQRLIRNNQQSGVKIAAA